ncbi:16S rRNA processing protein RimM [gamma proteobacterium NOR5-3]|nr:16S rRNA processing protein RimM [gamma proteobacterium NOR5-3]
MLLAGKITGAYGIKGWVKLHAFTDPPQNFFAFSRHQIERQGRTESIQFADGRAQGKGLIARVVGVDSRTDAELLRGTQIWVPKEELPELGPDDYYWHQLQGLQVWSQHEGQSLLLGVVDHLLETGANDVLVLRPCDGSIDKRERLIPYLPDDVVQGIDIEAGSMTVVWHPED